MFSALLNISFNVAPDDFASLPNFLTSDFSSSICAYLTEREILRFNKSNSVIDASNLFPG